MYSYFPPGFSSIHHHHTGRMTHGMSSRTRFLRWERSRSRTRAEMISTEPVPSGRRGGRARQRPSGPGAKGELSLVLWSGMRSVLWLCERPGRTQMSVHVQKSTPRRVWFQTRRDVEEMDSGAGKRVLFCSGISNPKHSLFMNRCLGSS